MDEAVKQLTPIVVEGLKLIIGAAVALAVAWFARRTREISAAREATLQVELQSREQHMTGTEKFQLAKQILAELRAPSNSTALIEKAVPSVAAKADAVILERKSQMPPPPDYVDHDTTPVDQDVKPL